MKDAKHRWFDSKYVQHTLGGLDCYPVYMQVKRRTHKRPVYFWECMSSFKVWWVPAVRWLWLLLLLPMQ